MYAKIKENWDYPEAIKEGFSGKVSIEFNIEKDGSVSDTKIVSSSGNTVFDKIAVASIKKASPFPEVPDELLENSKIGEYKRLIIKGNFNYNK